MFISPPNPAVSGARPTRTALHIRVFLSVFFLVILTVTLITFILPESFCSAARVMLGGDMATNPPAGEAQRPADEPDRHWLLTQIEVIRSEVVLDKVIQDLNLNSEWAGRYGLGERLRTSETLDALRRSLDVRPVDDTGVVEIRMYSPNPREAATIANAIAESYAGHGRGGASQAAGIPRVEIVDRAVPATVPARPNKTLNIALGIVAGTVLGLAAAAAAAWIGSLAGRKPGAAVAG